MGEEGGLSQAGCLASLRTLGSKASHPSLSDSRHPGERASRPPGGSIQELMWRPECLAWVSTAIRSASGFLQLKRKQKSNTVYSQQYLKSIGSRSCSICCCAFVLSCLEGRDHPSLFPLWKLLITRALASVGVAVASPRDSSSASLSASHVSL